MKTKNIKSVFPILLCCFVLVLLVNSFAFGFMDSKILIAKPDYGFIVIDAGSERGIRLGQTFGILHNKRAVGYLEVIKLRPLVAACSIKQLESGFELKENDIITLYRTLHEIPYTYIPRVKEEVFEEPAPDELVIRAKEKQREELIKNAERIAQDIIDEKKKRLVSFNFKNADIVNILRLFSYEVGINILVSDRVEGQVTVNFENVDFEDALDAILQQAGFTYVFENNIYKVIPLEEAKKITVTQAFIPMHAKVETIKTVLTDGNLISDIGRIILDRRSNTLMVVDRRENMEKIKSMIQKLDVRPKQVSIGVKILDVTLHEEERFGIDWSWVKPRADAVTDDTFKVGYFKEIGAIDAVGLFRYGTLGVAEVALLIEALKRRDGTEILAKPLITTLNREEATINIVEKIAYIADVHEIVTDGIVTITHDIEEKEYGVTLSVTPHITRDGDIVLEVKQEVSLLREIIRIGRDIEYPVIMMRSAETKVIIRDGETLLIGGLVSKERRESVRGVPFLSDIPILGAFFRRTEKSYVDSELVILITPQIVK